jgi:hypothetical protein
MIRSKDGVSLDAVMKATGWQRHTVRGFVSGTLTRKLGRKVESFVAKTRSAATGSPDDFERYTPCADWWMAQCGS